MADFFSTLVYAPEDIITFQHGIPGFEKNRAFVLVNQPAYAPFEWLACVDGTRLRFAMVNPLLFVPDYAPKLSKEQLADLAIEKADDLLLYVIVTIRENPAESTANLAGPIILNKSARLGKQVIIEDDRYSTQEPILRK